MKLFLYFKLLPCDVTGRRWLVCAFSPFRLESLEVSSDYKGKWETWRKNGSNGSTSVSGEYKKCTPGIPGSLCYSPPSRAISTDQRFEQLQVTQRIIITNRRRRRAIEEESRPVAGACATTNQKMTWTWFRHTRPEGVNQLVSNIIYYFSFLLDPGPRLL